MVSRKNDYKLFQIQYESGSNTGSNQFFRDLDPFGAKPFVPSNEFFAEKKRESEKPKLQSLKNELFW